MLQNRFVTSQVPFLPDILSRCPRPHSKQRRNTGVGLDDSTIQSGHEVVLQIVRQVILDFLDTLL